MMGFLKGLAGFALYWVLMAVFGAVFACSFCIAGAVVSLFAGQFPAAFILAVCAGLTGLLIIGGTSFIDWATDRLYA